MKEKKRFEITLETHELTIVRFASNKTDAYCPICGADTPHLPVAECASILSLTETTVFRLAESGQIHARESADGRLLLCGGSLATFEQDKKEQQL